jgi:tetratricopeptide (TPR) repeat protein
MRALVALGLVVVLSPSAHATDFVPAGTNTLSLLLGNDAYDDVDRSVVARTVEKQGYWSGEPIGVSQCASCHPDAAAQWATSAHRFASFNNPYYSASVEQFRKERGAVASRFCAGCHDPAMVASGRIDAPVVDHRAREAQAGIVCLACHSLADHPQGHGNGELAARLEPWPTRGPGHKARLRPAVMATADFCGNCHRVGLEEKVTGGRWLRGQDELLAWRASSIAGQGAAAIHRAPTTQRCQDCHMPLVPAPLGDAAAKVGKDGIARIRSHQFVGANAALPHLRGDAEAEARVTAFLQDRVSLDLDLAVNGELDVILRSRGVGHRFPGGTMDSNEVWVAVRAFDEHDRLIAESGALRPAPAGPPELAREAHLVRAQMVDGNGVPLRFRDVQHARGVVDDNSLPPGEPRVVRYALPKATARVEARLLYRKLSAEYLRFACAQIPDAGARARCEAAPVVEMAKGELVVPSVLASVEQRCESAPWERVLDHGIGLAGALADRAEEARAWLECAAKREPKRVEPVLGLMRLALALGRTDEVMALGQRAAKLARRHPAAPYLEAIALSRAYRAHPARLAAERLSRLLPDDPTTLAILARARGLDHEPRGAMRAAMKLLSIDPDSEEGHYQCGLALRDLGRAKDAEREEAAYLQHRVAAEDNLALRAGFRRWQGQVHDETEPLHTHMLIEIPATSTRAAQR